MHSCTREKHQRFEEQHGWGFSLQDHGFTALSGCHDHIDTAGQTRQTVTAATPQAVLTLQLGSHPRLISSQRLLPTHRLLILLCWPPPPTQEGREKQQEILAHSRHMGSCHNALCHLYCRYPRDILGAGAPAPTPATASLSHTKSMAHCQELLP